jgi:coenzyme F420-0:L-glutamate ligase/coenzyme F420-1:gamma-L-glutamate ligase
VRSSSIPLKAQMNTLTNSRSNMITSLGNTARGKSGSSSKLSRSTLTATDFHTFLRTRRSIRRFKPDPVPDSVIESILHTATFAPSAHNRQPWRFVVVTDSSVKTRLGEAITSKMRADMQAEGAETSDIEKRVTMSLRRMDEAPVIIVLCRDINDVRADTPEETIMGVQSTALAGLQLLLAAHAEGLGGNWICWPLYAQEATRSALELPETSEPQAQWIIQNPKP